MFFKLTGSCIPDELTLLLFGCIMANSAFRPPQFSEDILWLPAWLQPYQLSSFAEQVEAQTLPQLAQQDLMIRENINDRREGYLSSREDAICSSFHLFLSGEDHLSARESTPFENIQPLHLHLSSGGISEDFLGQLHDIIHMEKNHSNREMEDGVGKGDLVPPMCTIRTPRKSQSQNPSKDNHSCKVKFQETFDAGVLENADVNDAVELAIAASEALAISELVKSGMPSEVSSPSLILEIALRVKEARSQFCLDNLDCSAGLINEVEETNSLHDLDGVTMMYAFEDVGLSQKDLNNAFVVGLTSLDSEMEFQYAHQEKSGDASFCRSVPIVENNLNASLCLSSATRGNSVANNQIPSSEDKGASKGVNFDVENVTSFSLQASQFSSLRIKDPGNADNVVNRVITEPFRSRWFGGWTGQEVEVTINRDCNRMKQDVTKFFIRETSLFSESVDVVADESSSVNKPEAGLNLFASSTPLGVLSTTTQDGVVPSQAPMISSSSSLADPLCSIVLCSISSENACADLASNWQNLGEEQGRHLNDTMVPIQVEGLDPAVSISHGEHVGLTKSEDTSTVYRRQFSSLKNYSMLEPTRNACLEDSTRVFFSNPTSPCRGIDDLSNINVQARQQYQDTVGAPNIGNPILEPTIKKLNSVRSTDNEIMVPEHQGRENFSPVILNYGTRRRFRACRIRESNNYIEEDNPNKASVPHMRKTPSAKTRKEVNFGNHNTSPSPVRLCSTLHSRPLEKGSPARKRVRFSDVDQFHQSHAGWKITSEGFPSKPIKRAKDFSPSSKLGTREKNYDSPATCHVKNRRRRIFRGLEFLLTGFSSEKERQFDALIRKHGGFVLTDIPPPPNLRGKGRSWYKNQKLPIVLSPQKVQTTKFLYGCAINTSLLKVKWLTDSIAANFALPPEKYLILSNQTAARKCTRLGQPFHLDNHSSIFDGVGVMLYGKPSFCTKLAKLIKHGGSQVFKTLQWLVHSLKSKKNSVGAIVVEDEGRASRHLKHCALEHKLSMMPESWIVDSLLSGKMLPFEKSRQPTPPHTVQTKEFPESEEI